MFENIGGKLKAAALGVFILEIIGTVAASIFAAIKSGGFDFVMFLIVLVVGIVVSYLSVVMLYAFGELVENSAIIVRQVEKINVSATGTESNVKGSSPRLNMLRRSSNGEYWNCPNCGMSNHKTAGSCGCGSRKPY